MEEKANPFLFSSFFYSQVKSVINLLFAAYTGDVSALRRFALSGMDMEQRDYDSRTALHVAAAEGHVEVVKFLLEACKVNPFPKDSHIVPGSPIHRNKHQWTSVEIFCQIQARLSFLQLGRKAEDLSLPVQLAPLRYMNIQKSSWHLEG
ncbi:UNVERIFIED_CONTAM: hypothetical protein K2H54_050978 [Gekko kuhli]